MAAYKDEPCQQADSAGDQSDDNSLRSYSVDDDNVKGGLNGSRHSVGNSSISSFMSALLNDSASEFGGSLADLQICIVPDNARNERRPDDEQPKIIRLAPSSSKGKLCRWKNEDKQKTRRQSDPCLINMVMKQRRKNSLDASPASRLQKPKTRPSMCSWHSDSNLLRMPTRTTSPRITKNTIAGTRSNSSRSLGNSNASWDNIGTTSRKSSANDLFQKMNMLVLPDSSSKKKAMPSSSSYTNNRNMVLAAAKHQGMMSGLTKSSSSGSMLQHRTTASSRQPHPVNNYGFSSSSSTNSRLRRQSSDNSPNSGSQEFKASIIKDPAALGLKLPVRSNTTIDTDSSAQTQSLAGAKGPYR